MRTLPNTVFKTGKSMLLRLERYFESMNESKSRRYPHNWSILCDSVTWTLHSTGKPVTITDEMVRGWVRLSREMLAIWPSGMGRNHFCEMKDFVDMVLSLRPEWANDSVHEPVKVTVEPKRVEADDDELRDALAAIRRLYKTKAWAAITFVLHALDKTREPVGVKTHQAQMPAYVR